MQDTWKQLQLTRNLNRVFSAQKKSPGRIRRQTKHQTYITASKLAYQEVLVISKSYREISKSVLANTDANPLRKELKNGNISECNDKTKQQTILFIKERGNPYQTTMPMKFYHFTSRQLVGPEISAKILEFFDNGLTEFLMFPEER